MENMRLGAFIVALMLLTTHVALPLPMEDGQGKKRKKADKNEQQDKSKKGKSKEGKSKDKEGKSKEGKEDRPKQRLKALLDNPQPNDSVWRTNVQDLLNQIQKRRPEVAERFQQKY